VPPWAFSFREGGLVRDRSAGVSFGAGRVQTFNVSFDESKFRKTSRRRASLLPMNSAREHHTSWSDAGCLPSQLPAALDRLDQPTFDAIKQRSFVFPIVRESVTKVALAGHGGENSSGLQTSRNCRGWLLAARAYFDAPAVMVRPRRMRPSLRTVPSGLHPPQTRWGQAGAMLLYHGRADARLYQTATPCSLELLHDLSSTATHLSGSGLSASAGRGTRRSYSVGSTDLSRSRPWTFLLLSSGRLLRDTDCGAWRSPLMCAVRCWTMI